MFQIPFKASSHPVEPLKYHREWDVPDLFGKYHVNRFGNKEHAIPGTAVIKDMEHIKKKADDVRKFNDTLEKRAMRMRGRKPIIKQKSEFAVKSYLHSILDEPIREVTETTQEAFQWSQRPLPKGDTEKERRRWIKNMKKGNGNYVGWACTSGYVAIDYQNPEDGKHGLHYGVEQGNLQQVELLMKFKADADLRDHLGYFPINCAWRFWKKYNRQEKRDPQEKLTCQILHTILSYGGSPDRQQQNGNTPLHTAAQYGPLRALFILMGFKANPNIPNKKGMLPVDVAVKYGNHDFAKMLRMWDATLEQLTDNDFQQTWKDFVKDTLREISTERTAEEMLFEVQMKEGVKALNKHGEEDFKLDDPLLRSTKEKTILDGLVRVPKPWEAGWDKWCAATKPSMDEIYGLKPKKEEEPDDPVGNKLKEKAEAAQKAAEQEAEENALVAKEKENNDDEEDSDGEGSYHESDDSDAEVDITQRKEAKAGSIVGLSRYASEKLPPQAERLPRPFTPRHSHELMDMALKHETVMEKRVSAHGQGIFLGSQEDLDEADHEFEGKMHEHEVKASGTIDAHLGLDDGDSLPTHTSSVALSPFGRPLTPMQARRQHGAYLMSLDAKFNNYTKRPCTASAIMVSLRTGVAPLDLTEEENSTQRLLSITDEEREARKPDRTAQLTGKKTQPLISSMGAYATAVEFQDDNPRRALLKRVAPRFASEREAAEQQVALAAAKMKKKGQLRRSQIDMVQGRRARFVDKMLLPPPKVENVFTKMQAERRQRQIEAAAEAATEAFGGETNKKNKKSKAKARAAYLTAAAVPYGKTRLKSAHMHKGGIDQPYSYVGGYYSVNVPL